MKCIYHSLFPLVKLHGYIITLFHALRMEHIYFFFLPNIKIFELLPYYIWKQFSYIKLKIFERKFEIFRKYSILYM